MTEQSPNVDYEERAGIPRWAWIAGLAVAIVVLAVVGAMAMGLIGHGKGSNRPPGHTPPPHAFAGTAADGGLAPAVSVPDATPPGR